MRSPDKLSAHLEHLATHPASRDHPIRFRGNRMELRAEDHFRPGEMVAIHVHPAMNHVPQPDTPYLAGHLHDFIEIAYVWNGSCGMEVEGQPLDLSRGDLVILDTNSTHRIFEKADTLLLNVDIRTEFFNEAFFRSFEKGDALAGFFASTIYSEKAAKRHLVFHTGDDAGIRQLITMLATEFFSEEYYYQRVMEDYFSILLLTVVRLQKQELSDSAAMEGYGESQVSELLTFMNDNLESITREMLAEHFSYSYSYISSVLRSATGMTFSRLKRTLRIQRAELLLRTTDRPISAVAQDSGFSNLSAFYEQFRKDYGMTPQDYRKKYK